MVLVGERRGEVRAGFWWGELKGRDHLEEMLVDEEDNLKIDLKLICRKMGWMKLAYGNDKLRVDLNSVTKFGFHKSATF